MYSVEGLSSVRSYSWTTVPRRAGSAVGDSAVVGSAVAGSAAASFSCAGSAAASSSGAGSDGATSTASRCYFVDCPREFRLRPLCWLQKSSGFYSFRPPHCPVDTSSLVILHHRRHTSADVYPTDTSQWSWTRHILIAPEQTRLTTLHQSIQSTVFPHYNRVFKNIIIKTPTATRIGRYDILLSASSYCSNWVNQSARERLGSTTSKNAAAQQAQGAPLRNRTN